MGVYDIFERLGCDSLARMVGPRKFEGIIHLRTEGDSLLSRSELEHRVGISSLKGISSQEVSKGQRPEEYAYIIERLIESNGVPSAICLDGDSTRASRLIEKIVEKYERVYGRVIIYNFSLEL